MDFKFILGTDSACPEFIPGYKMNLRPESPGDPGNTFDGRFHATTLQTMPGRRLFPENKKTFGNKTRYKMVLLYEMTHEKWLPWTSASD